MTIARLFIGISLLFVLLSDYIFTKFEDFPCESLFYCMNALVALILYVLKDKRVVWSLKNIISGKRLPSHIRRVSLDKMELSVGGEKSSHRNISRYNQTEIEMETCFWTPLQQSTTMEMVCLGTNQHAQNVIDSNVSMDQEDVVLKLTNVAKQQAEVALKQTEVAFIQTQAAEVQIRTAHRLSVVAVEQNIEVMRLLESVSKHNESVEHQVDVDVHVDPDLNKALKDGDESNTCIDKNDVMIQTNYVEIEQAEVGESKSSVICHNAMYENDLFVKKNQVVQQICRPKCEDDKVVNPTFTDENQGIQAAGQPFIAKSPSDQTCSAENQTDQADKQTCTAVKQPCTAKKQPCTAKKQSEEAAEQTDLAIAKPTKRPLYVHVHLKHTSSAHL